jgi:hypothetical protein
MAPLLHGGVFAFAMSVLPSKFRVAIWLVFPTKHYHSFSFLVMEELMLMVLLYSLLAVGVLVD